MKKMSLIFVAGALAGLTVLLTGCEWESVDDSFNTSKGAGATVNFSGVYRAKSGGFLVGTNITQLVIVQTGNAIEAWDNNNSYYVGSVGSPGVIAPVDPVTGLYPAGATMVQAQMNFAGKNGDANVNFVGIVHAVAVADVKGPNTVTTGLKTNDVFTIGTATNTVYSQTTTTYNQQNTTSYTITEANSQYVLDGNWIQDDSGSQTVSAISPAASGVFTTTTTSN